MQIDQNRIEEIREQAIRDSMADPGEIPIKFMTPEDKEHSEKTIAWMNEELLKMKSKRISPDYHKAQEWEAGRFKHGVVDLAEKVHGSIITEDQARIEACEAEHAKLVKEVGLAQLIAIIALAVALISFLS